jgi:hypothetical protein
MSRDPQKSASSGVHCRQIGPSDREALVQLLARGFPERDTRYWERALDRLYEHAATHGHPHCGYVLQAGGVLVGALLMIFWRPETEGSATRCNLSSWYVDDRFRTYASFLVRTATRDKTVTYFNISPEDTTRETVEAQGFTRYCEGLFLGLPLLSWHEGEPAHLTSGEPPPEVHVDPVDAKLMRGHASFDCIKAWCVTGERAYPFIFMKTKRVRNLLPTAHVVYCDSPEMVSRFAGPIGRFLAKQGIFALTIDANGPPKRMFGWYLHNRMPKYFKGPRSPRLGDLAFTELTMFGF